MFNLPKVTRELRLADYAPEYSAAILDVWVNPPRKVLAEFYQIQQAVGLLVTSTEGLTNEQRGERFLELNKRTMAWLSEVWSQGTDPARHFTPEQVQKMSDYLADIDPQAWVWLIQSTLALIKSYREGNQKN